MPADSLDGTPAPANNVVASKPRLGIECEGVVRPAASRDTIRAAKELAQLKEPGPADFLDTSSMRVKQEESLAGSA